MLWEKAFDGSLKLDEGVDIKAIAKDYEVAGGAIVNVLKFCSIRAVQHQKTTVSKDDLIEGIKYELLKEGKTG